MEMKKKQNSNNGPRNQSIKNSTCAHCSCPVMSKTVVPNVRKLIKQSLVDQKKI